MLIADTRELIVRHGREILRRGEEVFLPTSHQRPTSELRHGGEDFIHRSLQFGRETVLNHVVECVVLTVPEVFVEYLVIVVFLNPVRLVELTLIINRED